MLSDWSRACHSAKRRKRTQSVFRLEVRLHFDVVVNKVSSKNV